MKRIFVPTTSPTDWQRLLAKPALHWKPGYSAMTAATAWEAAGDKLPTEISAKLDASGAPELQGLKLLTAIPEWETPLPGGDRPSCTDVLAICRNDVGLCVIAVEAKVNEDFGPTLQQKLVESSLGQTTRIDYLRTLLGMSFSAPVRYQLLHRTASALLSAKEFHAATAVMMIQSWGNNPALPKDFEAFCGAMGSEDLPGGMKVVSRFEGPRLFLGWADGLAVHLSAHAEWHPDFEADRGVGSPAETIRLLDELEALGFDDTAFALLHHFRLEGRQDTIAAHRRYCEGLKERFQSGGTNEAVQKRLKLVLRGYRRGGFSSGSSAVFRQLAEASWMEISPTVDF